MKKLLLILLLVALPVFAACPTLHSITVPVEVTQTVELRSTAMTRVSDGLTRGAIDDSALLGALRSDLDAWQLMRDQASSLGAPDDFTVVVQSQTIALDVAIAKIEAGEYNPQQKVDLVDALALAWANLSTYFQPEAQ